MNSDLERLPSGKFATNAAIMALGAFAYNILRFIGQLGLLGEQSPVRHSAKRRRLKTVIQELMYLAARFILSPVAAGLAVASACLCRITYPDAQFENDSKPFLPLILAGQSNLVENLRFK